MKSRRYFLFDALLVLIVIVLALGIVLAVTHMVLPELFQQKGSKDRAEDLIVHDNSYNAGN